MKSCLGILLVFFTFVAVVGGGALIWYLSNTAEFSRKEAAASTTPGIPKARVAVPPTAPPKAQVVPSGTPPKAIPKTIPQTPLKKSTPFGER